MPPASRTTGAVWHDPDDEQPVGHFRPGELSRARTCRPLGGPVPLVAGVDSSTQSCKVVIRDAETGQLVREGRTPHPAGTEVAPAAWEAALGDAVAQAGGLEDVAAASIAGQQQGMVCLDADGTVVRDAVLWNDTRSA